MKWHKYPEETPPKDENTYGEYLIRGKGGLNEKLHYYVAFWCWIKKEGLCGFFYRGNEFCEIPSGEFEWVDLKTIDDENG